MLTMKTLAQATGIGAVVGFIAKNIIDSASVSKPREETASVGWVLRGQLDDLGDLLRMNGRGSHRFWAPLCQTISLLEQLQNQPESTMVLDSNYLARVLFNRIEYLCEDIKRQKVQIVKLTLEVEEMLASLKLQCKDIVHNIDQMMAVRFTSL